MSRSLPLYETVVDPPRKPDLSAELPFVIRVNRTPFVRFNPICLDKSAVRSRPIIPKYARSDE